METQNKIKQTLTQPEAIKYISNKIDSNAKINRTELADLLCDHFHFFDPRRNVMVKKKWTQNFKQPVLCVFVQNP